MTKKSKDYYFDWNKYVETPKKIRFIEEEAQKKALEVADDDMKDLIQILVDTGCRLGEIVSLDVQDIYLDQRLIKLFKTKTNSPRTIPMTNRVYEILSRRSMERIFHFSSRVASKRMATLNKKLGEYKFNLHELRHTTASKLANKGCDTSTIQKVLGHHNSSTTDRYVHLSGVRLREAIDLLEA